MGLQELKSELQGTSEIKKSIKEGLSGIVPIKKADRKGKMMDRRVNLELAENGVVLNISTEVEFGSGEKRDWKYFRKTLVYKDLKEAMPAMEAAVTEFTVGQDVMESAVLATKKGKIRVSTKKRDAISFTVEPGESGVGGHVHMAMGKIEDRTVDGKVQKFFVGETLPNAIYWPMGTKTNDPENSFTQSIKETLVAHIHKVDVPLSLEDESGWRVMGQTVEVEGHSHPVNVLDFYSVETSNAPDA